MGIVPWPPLNPSPVRLTRLLPTTNSSTPPPSFRPFHSSHARPAALSPKPTIPVLDYRVPTAAFPSRLPQRISYCHDPEQADNELSRLNDEVVRLVEAGEEVPDHTLSLSLRAVDKLGGRFGSELSLAVITIVTVDDVLSKSPTAHPAPTGCMLSLLHKMADECDAWCLPGWAGCSSAFGANAR